MSAGHEAGKLSAETSGPKLHLWEEDKFTERPEGWL